MDRRGRKGRSRPPAGLVIAVVLGILSSIAGCGNEADLSGPAPAAAPTPPQTPTQT